MRFLPGDFEVLTSTSGDTATLTLRGELDMATVDAVEQAIAAVGDEPRRLVIDLRELRFLDSMGLELFLTLDTRLREAGRELVLVRGPRAVHRLFEVMQLESVLQIVDAAPSWPGGGPHTPPPSPRTDTSRLGHFVTVNDWTSVAPSALSPA
jgi:anti-sigma B factor antagonist